MRGDCNTIGADMTPPRGSLNHCRYKSTQATATCTACEQATARSARPATCSTSRAPASTPCHAEAPPGRCCAGRWRCRRRWRGATSPGSTQQVLLQQGCGHIEHRVRAHAAVAPARPQRHYTHSPCPVPLLSCNCCCSLCRGLDVRQPWQPRHPLLSRLPEQRADPWRLWGVEGGAFRGQRQRARPAASPQRQPWRTCPTRSSLHHPRSHPPSLHPTPAVSSRPTAVPRGS